MALLRVMVTHKNLLCTKFQLFWKNCKSDLTSRGSCVILMCIKAAMKTRGRGKTLREGFVWCKKPVNLPWTIPLLSCVCGNATPGAPVTVPMSDGKMP